MAILANLQISEEVAQLSDIVEKIDELSVSTIYETKIDASQKLDDSKDYTDEEIAKLSSELSNYWKISKDPDDQTKIVSQEMDYLVMRDWATPEGERGHNLKRFMYVKQGEWYCDPSKNSFNGGPNVAANAKDGTTTNVLNT